MSFIPFIPQAEHSSLAKFFLIKPWLCKLHWWRLNSYWLQHSSIFLETQTKFFEHPQNFFETPLKYLKNPMKQTSIFFETHLKLSWNTRKTLSKHTFEIPLKLSSNILQTSLKHPWTFIKHLWNFFNLRKTSSWQMDVLRCSSQLKTPPPEPHVRHRCWLRRSVGISGIWAGGIRAAATCESVPSFASSGELGLLIIVPPVCLIWRWEIVKMFYNSGGVV